MPALENLRKWLEQQGQDRLRLIGILASLAWLVLVMLSSWLRPDSQDDGGLLAWLVWLLGVGLPLALIWFAVHCAQVLDVLRAEADGLRLALAQMRGTDDPLHDIPAAPVMGPGIAPVTPHSASSGAPLRPAPAPRRPVQVPPRPPLHPADAAQAQPAKVPVLSPTELYFALNFPEGPEDHEAVRCLQLALADPELARLIRAAQDVITLLAGRGIYMDDLPVPETDAALWQRFAQGSRGQAVAGLAVIDNAAALNATGTMLADDEVFRDVAHHFMRRFDRLLTRRGQTEDGAVLAVLAETRSGRAFILLAQVSGMLGGATPMDAAGAAQAEPQQS